MKKALSLLGFALSLSLLAGCAAEKAAPAPAPSLTDAVPAAEAKSDGIAAPVGGNSGGERAPAGRALIVTSEIQVTTKNVGDTTARIRSEVERAGGFVSALNAHGLGDSKSATIEVRVPADKRASIRSLLTGLGEITSDSEKVDDVTEARADLKARLHNARMEEKRVVDIMEHQTGKLSEVMEASRELARVRENIERLEAQERTMEGKISLATMKISVNGPAVPVQAEPEAWRTPGKSIGRAFSAGLRGTAAFGVYAAMALAAVSPVLLPIGAILAIAITVARRRRQELPAAV